MSTTTTVYALTKPTTGGDAGVWGNPVDANFDTIDNELARPRTVFLSPTYNVGGTTTLDLNQTTGARTFVFTVSGASTIAFSNVPSSSFKAEIECLITNGGAFVLTWPASVVWLNGAAPQMKASGVNSVRLRTKDGGTTWYGDGTFPRFRAFRDNSTQSIADSTDTVVDWQTAEFDIGGNFSIATDKFTIPAGGDEGTWLLHAQVRWINNATGTRRLWIRKNGATIVCEADQLPTNSISHNQEVSRTIHRPAVGDYFEVLCRQTSGGALNIDASTVGAYTYFEGSRIA
jgi:hypothetical protein